MIVGVVVLTRENRLIPSLRILAPARQQSARHFAGVNFGIKLAVLHTDIACCLELGISIPRRVEGLGLLRRQVNGKPVHSGNETAGDR